uniref:Osteoclast associated Ig-like receptor n=1 Tax=Mandrillus leucophaeus TaxID=9568 RepID=A0A2K5XAZ6_MANLE
MALVLILQLLTLFPPALYHKPWLGAQPATVVTPGVNVTLRCRAPQPAWRFGLFKLGEISPPLFRDVSSELAEFFLEEVTPAQGGSYHCCYRRPDWRPGVWSQPSDPLELLVTDSSSSDYTRGNLVRLGLAGLVLISLGALVTFDWRSQSRAPAGVRP